MVRSGSIPLRQRVVVVGGGVSGLSTAVRLAEDPGRRFAVEVVAEKVGAEALSRVAAALFYPYAVDHPHIDRWLAESLRTFRELCAVPESGVRMARGAEVHSRPVDDAPWRHLVLDYEHRRPSGDRLARRFVDGHCFAAPVIEMPIYLPYLVARLQRAGAAIERRPIASLDDVIAPDVIVVNASGVRARDLAPDPQLTPTLGQVVRIARGDVDEFRICEEEGAPVAYVVPRSGDVVLGSIDVPWSAEKNGYDPPAPRDEVVDDIIDRCAELDERVRDAAVLETYCGLRPRRFTVRVEVDADRLARGRRLVHDYGHGGAGVTLSWGCAAETAARVAGLARG